MCGICGMYGFTDLSLINKMLDIVRHRGPDEKGCYSDDHIAMGIQRLSIIDIKGGHQPIFNEDGSIVVVLNGEIYNYRELREKLEQQGHRFSTRSDTEVIVHAYEDSPTDFVTKLEGMFAFALWDKNTKTLILARDRLGKKPLYYLISPDGYLIFGSEIKQLLLYDEYSFGINRSALYHLLSYKCVPDSDTLFANIKKLPPGCIMAYSRGRFDIHPYWELRVAVTNLDIDTYVRRLQDLLRQAVRKRLMSEVPLGAYLSGGLDSSTIVALMSEMMAEPVKTFTATYDEIQDESSYANLVADHFGTDHAEIKIKLSEITNEIPTVIWHLDEPVYDPASFPFYLVTQGLKRYATVALLGEGSDELFAGYDDYKILPHKVIPKPLRTRAYLAIKLPFSRFDKDELCTQEFKTQVRENPDVDSMIVNWYNDSPHDLLTTALLFDVKNILPNYQLMRVDKLAMAHSVEARAPFMDHTLVEFAFTIPPELKLNRGIEKYILKKAMAYILPKETIERKKLAFPTPLAQWIGGLDEIIEQVLDSSVFVNGKYFKDEYLQRLLQKHIRIRKKKYTYQVWLLFMLELWYRVFADKRLEAPSLNKLI
jgi:asparagine synthase (glutamine-hydrolysing)